MGYKKVKLNHICLKALEVGHTYTYPIFYKYKDNIFKPLIKKGEGFNSTIQKKIDQLQITDAYVLLDDHSQYEKDTQHYLSKLVHDTNIPIDTKSEILYDLTNETMQELFSGELNKAKIDRSQELINESIYVILSDESASRAMMKVTSYDYYTYSHSVNVSVYALGFGAYLGLDKVQLHLLGSAAILHDLGKEKIPNEIVNKNGRLTDEEFTIMKKHPSLAVEILQSLGESNTLLLKIIEQHHEKLDGSGYPNKLQKEDIHIYSQIITIADVFDALTTKRSYKDALKSYEALDIMCHQMSGELNSKLLEKFIFFMDKEIKKDKNI